MFIEDVKNDERFLVGFFPFPPFSVALVVTQTLLFCDAINERIFIQPKRSSIRQSSMPCWAFWIAHKGPRPWENSNACAAEAFYHLSFLISDRQRKDELAPSQERHARQLFEVGWFEQLPSPVKYPTRTPQTILIQNITQHGMMRYKWAKKPRGPSLDLLWIEVRLIEGYYYA